MTALSHEDSHEYFKWTFIQFKDNNFTKKKSAINLGFLVHDELNVFNRPFLNKVVFRQWSRDHRYESRSWMVSWHEIAKVYLFRLNFNYCQNQNKICNVNCTRMFLFQMIVNGNFTNNPNFGKWKFECMFINTTNLYMFTQSSSTINETNKKLNMWRKNHGFLITQSIACLDAFLRV